MHTQPRLASAWMSCIKLALWASQTPFSKLHYEKACLRTTLPSQVTALIFAGAGPKRIIRLIHWHMLAHKHKPSRHIHKSSQCGVTEATEEFDWQQHSDCRSNFLGLVERNSNGERSKSACQSKWLPAPSWAPLAAELQVQSYKRYISCVVEAERINPQVVTAYILL